MKLKFGKYKGMTVEQAVKTDPQYCKSLLKRNDANLTLELIEEIEIELSKSPSKKHRIIPGVENGSAVSQTI